MTLRVLDSGLYTLVVDLGRPRCRSLGVPVGGAADRSALILGNALVGNPPDAAALEITLNGPTLEADCDLACVVYGTAFDLHSDRQKLTAGTTFTLTAGERLEIRWARGGARAYFCVAGGIQERSVLGSHSGLAPLTAGTEVSCRPGTIHGRSVRLPIRMPPVRNEGKVLRVVEGAQGGWFSRNGRFTLEDSRGLPPTFQVTASSNRMGLRLQGEPLPVPQREMVSEPVCPGSVQVTRDGQCIILGVDGQTIGGYPKIAQVISADLDLLGQLRPGDRVCFVRVTLAEAEALWRHKQAELCEWVMRLRVSLAAFTPVVLPRRSL